jgi:cellulose synthase/poly-beta-1,6-N-acetylglucosamine synthase-like glycosyltransferase
VTNESNQPLPKQPRISVVVPVRNEARFIAATLRELLAQDYPKEQIEVLVCDGRSRDGTREIVRALSEEDPRVVLLDNPGLRSSTGRNVGFRAAKGEVLLVVDGHVHIPSRRLFSDLVRCLRESGADCAARTQRLRPTPGKPWSHAIALARASWIGHGRDSTIYEEVGGIGPAATSGAAYRREVIEQIGFVDERFDACEDLDFNRRIDEAELRCVHDASLEVEYFARETPAALFRQMLRYGFGRFNYLQRNLSRFSWSQLVPVVLVLAGVLLPLLAVLRSPLAWLAAALLLAYAIAVGATSLSLALRHGIGHLPRLLAVIPLIHSGLGLGFLHGLLRRGRLPEAE